MVDSNGNKVIKRSQVWIYSIISTIVGGVITFVVITSLTSFRSDHEDIIILKKDVKTIESEIEKKVNSSTYKVQTESMKKDIEEIKADVKDMKKDVKDILKNI